MPVGLITIQKQYLGEEWVNTYCVITENNPIGTFGEADISALLAGETSVTDANTNYANAAYKGEDSILFALVSFERQIHGNFVNVTQVYITDGKDNSTSPANTFAVFDTAFQCARNFGVSGPAPGNVTLQVNRIPAGFSARRGRAFYRLVLDKDDVTAGATRLVDFTNLSTRNVYETLIDTSITQATLDKYFASGSSSSSFTLAIPRYVPDDDPSAAGDLAGATPVAGLTVRNVTSRQVKRGRKRPSGVTSG